MPVAASSAAGPTPESCRSCGDPTLPAARMVSTLACAKHLPSRAWANSMPSARRTPSRAADPHALDECVRDDREIRTRQRRTEKGFGRVPAHAALLVHLEERAAEVVAAIELADLRNAALFGRVAPGLEDFPSKAGVFDAQLASHAVHLVGAVLIVLDLLEQRQHVVPRPSRVAKRGPVVVVLLLAAHVDHRVDGGAAAEDAAARVVDRAAGQMLVGLRLVAPVGAWIGDRVEIADRDVDPEPVVLSAGFEQEDPLGRIWRTACLPERSRRCRRRR